MALADAVLSILAIVVLFTISIAVAGAGAVAGAALFNASVDGVATDDSFVSFRLLHFGNWPATLLQIDPLPIRVAVVAAAAVGAATTLATTLDTVLFTFDSEQSTIFETAPSNRILSAILAKHTFLLLLLRSRYVLLGALDIYLYVCMSYEVRCFVCVSRCLVTEYVVRGIFDD